MRRLRARPRDGQARTRIDVLFAPLLPRCLPVALTTTTPHFFALFLCQVWDIKGLDTEADSPAKMRVTAAVAAHDKDINAVAVAPNDSGEGASDPPPPPGARSSPVACLQPGLCRACPLPCPALRCPT